MIIIVCFNMECTGMWQNTTYNSMDDCIAASPAVKEYFMATWPNSNGEIYCLLEEEFKEWKEKLENNGRIPLPNKPPV